LVNALSDQNSVNTFKNVNTPNSTYKNKPYSPQSKV